MSEEQTISPLSADDHQRLERQRSVVHRYVADESRASLGEVTGKLGLIRALLDADAFRADQTWELQCLGIVLGDALVQHVTGGEWVMVEDQYGRDPAVRIQGTSVLLFPMTMISKRIEGGQKVDVFAMFNGILDHIDALREPRAD